MRDKVLESFLSVRNGFSPDRVIADPELDALFLGGCRQRGLTEPDEELNQVLLNARKAGALADIPTEHRTWLPNVSECAFASEIAVRFLERRDGVTLDQVLCSPKRAAEFDRVAARICPGLTPLEYRWGALRLRKRRRLKPELLARVSRSERVLNCCVSDLDLLTIPQSQGLYILFDSHTALYVGETKNLRRRLSKHLEHSDNKGLAQWLWEHGSDGLHVEIHILAKDTRTKARKALEADLIDSRRPVFNCQRVGE
jgi:hypothetical protein